MKIFFPNYHLGTDGKKSVWGKNRSQTPKPLNKTDNMTLNAIINSFLKFRQILQHHIYTSKMSK